MTSGGFWEPAWSIIERLKAGPVGDASDSSLVAELVGDLTLQRYAFLARDFDDPRWLGPFRQEGLFNEPPPVEKVEGGARAWGWPALTYLRAVGNSDPSTSAEILEGLVSENWWVVSDALSVAVELPTDVVARPVLSLLRDWERLAVQWTDPDTLIRSLRRIAETNDGGKALTEALVRILGRFTEERANRYDLSELVPQIRAELGDHASGPLADAVEEVLLFRAAATEWHPLISGLDDLRVDADGVELLVQEWLESAVSEAKASGGFAVLRRCVRLLRANVALLRQMGLRALSLSLSTEPIEKRALQLLATVAARDDLTREYDELPELLRLFASHFGSLGIEQQAGLIRRIDRQARGPEPVERIFARDWLGALRPYLGARERHLLVELEPEFGPPRESFARPRVEAFWVGPRSPLTLDELQEMPIEDLRGYVSHVPVQPDNEWPHNGATPEGFARMLQPLVRNRIDELWPYLVPLAQSAGSSVVLFYLCWGVRDAFGEESRRVPERLPAVQAFITAAVDWARSTEPSASGPRSGDYSVARAIADMLEGLGGWLVDTPDVNALLTTIEWLLTSDDPPKHEPEVTAMDPPTRAINSVRGEAVLAALRMLSSYWGDNGRDRSALAEGIEKLLVDNVRDERSAAVLSSYGRYLGAIIKYWSSFFDSYHHLLLPTDPAATDRWAAVLGTYITFYNPHRLTAKVLRRHFALAVQRLPELADGYVGKQAERLLMHLIALSLPQANDSGTWLDLLHGALDAAESEATARVVHNLAFAVEREGLEIPAEWTLSFVGRRADSLTARRSGRASTVASKDGEASALVKLLFANGVSPPACIGHIRHLVQLGARLDLDETVRYLTEHDQGHSQSGAVVLSLAASQDSVEGYWTSVEDCKQLIRSYAPVHADLAWRIVEAMGARGVFAFEDVARELTGLRP